MQIGGDKWYQLDDNDIAYECYERNPVCATRPHTNCINDVSHA